MRALKLSALPLLALLVDRGLKLIAQHAPSPSLHGWFAFHRNEGIAFSIPLPQHIMLVGFLIAFAILCSAFIIELKKSTPRFLPFFLIFAGALSNLFDRVRVGAVIDYIAVPPLAFTFNIADAMIVFGIFTLLFRQNYSAHNSLQTINSSSEQ